MTYLLNTNVVSEWVKPRPDPGVLAWLDGVDEDRTYLSVITLAELRRGVERLPAGKRRMRLDVWLSAELPLRFERRVLAIDAAIADACGRVVARRQTAGHPIEAMDAFIAATANVYKLKLVTRNVADFEAAGPEIVNPWMG